MKSTTGTPAYFRQIFQNVGSIYQERNSSSGRLQAIDYSQGVGTGKVTHVGAQRIVRPSVSDFICDVEIAAVKALNAGELAYFQAYYRSAKLVILNQGEINEAGYDFCLEEHVQSFPSHLREAVASLDRRIREKLGRHFYEVGISPLSRYMAPRDTRRVAAYGSRQPHEGRDVSKSACPYLQASNSSSVVLVQ